MPESRPPTFGVYAGVPCHHRMEELPVLRYLLGSAQPLWVVEFGTMYGGFAAFLAETVAPWGGSVLTVDNIRYPGMDEVCARWPTLTFLQADLLIEPQPLVISWLSRPRALLYCDDGDKETEVAKFADLLADSGVVGVHDYGNEARAEVLEPWMSAHRFQPYEHERFVALGCNPISRFWRRA